MTDNVERETTGDYESIKNGGVCVILTREIGSEMPEFRLIMKDLTNGDIVSRIVNASSMEELTCALKYWNKNSRYKPLRVEHAI